MGQDRVEELKCVLHPNVIRANEREAKGLNDVFEMFKKGDEACQRPFTFGLGVLDDLHMWSRKITILGHIIARLAELEGKQDYSFFYFGEALGDIIEDYAKAINCVVNNENFRDHFLRTDEEVTK